MLVIAKLSMYYRKYITESSKKNNTRDITYKALLSREKKEGWCRHRALDKMTADRCGDCSGVPEAGSRAQARLTRRQTHKEGRRCRGAGKGNDKNSLQPSHFTWLLKSVRWSHLKWF